MNELYELDKVGNSDHVATPRYVVEDIYNIIDVESFQMIWFPFNNYDSEFKLRAKELNLRYKATHIFDDLGNDFFQTEPPKGCDLLISNPPFSKQNLIIERSFYLVDSNNIKAFALLLPLATLETPKRAELFERYYNNLSILVFKRRIKFIGHNQVYPRGCCWVCYNIKSLSNKKLVWI